MTMQRRELLALGAALAVAGGARAQVLDINDAINKAGRQRMLSQRCAKFYLALSWDAAVHDAKAELDKARGEFIAAHRVLFEAPEATAAIRAELDLAQNQWVFFENALQLGNTAGQGARRASEVFRASENVLQVMDRVTGMYARLNVAA